MKPLELILHLGFPKCASTSMQAAWTNLPFFLGRSKLKPSDLTWQLRCISNIPITNPLERYSLSTWVSNLHNLRCDHSRILLSDEALTGRSHPDYLDIFPVGGFSDQFSSAINNRPILNTIRAKKKLFAFG